jgi:ubiquinol-cytochrome c reductase cytochrome c subunit
MNRRPARGDTLRSVGGLLALVGLVVGALAAWAMNPAAGARAGVAAAGWPATDTAVVEAGRSLYTANCASCHGPAAEGGPGGPPLIGVGAASADFYLRTGRMPLSAPGQQAVRQEPAFDEAGIQALVAYVASLGEGPDIPQVSGAGDLQHGWDLFQANCAACHNATGAGNAIGGGFVAVGLGEADPRTVAEATIIGPGPMPAFGFDDQQLADITTYISWLNEAPAPGGAAIGQTGPVA